MNSRFLAGLALPFAAAFTLAQAGTLIVDPSAPQTPNAPLGTPIHPFTDLQVAANRAQPGDTVLVMAGRYPERVRIKTSGTTNQPIIFGARPRHSAIVGGFDVAASHVRIEGFTITSEHPAVAVQLEGSYCEILDNDIHDMLIGVAGTVGKPDANGTRDYSSVTHNRIAYNRVYHSEYGFVLLFEAVLRQFGRAKNVGQSHPGHAKFSPIK